MRTRRDENKSTRGRSVSAITCLVLTVALFLSPQVSNAQVEVLDETCVVSVANRTLPVNPSGTFALNGPFLIAGQYRVRIICDRPGGIVQKEVRSLLDYISNPLKSS